MTLAVTRLTLLSPLGLYPPNDIVTDFGRFVVDDDIAFIVTTCTSGVEIDDRELYSEVEFLTVEEIRFLGCLTIACPESAGTLQFYPIPEHTTLSHDLMASRSVFLEAGRRHARDVHAQCYTGVLVLGPSVGNLPYSLKDRGLDQEVVEQLCSQVNVSEPVVIRGLGSLIKADMLFTRREFAEPATIMLHISLAATQEMVFDVLRQKGVPSPSSKDASKYLALAFGELPRGRQLFRGFLRDT